MVTLIFRILILLILFIPCSAHAQTIIAGDTVYCNDVYGVPVVTISAPHLNDIGMARIEFNGARVIYLNSNILYTLPHYIQLFWYFHECAHHALGHTYGFNVSTRENEADCWAIRFGRNFGWLSRKMLLQMDRFFISQPGTPWGHLPGPLRLENFHYCYNS